ncbi:MAG: nitroreductase family protein [Candidatus Aenigmatarchaeota archaeon]
MEFFDVVDKRRSVRKFLSRKIEEEKLMKIFQTANLAPSAGNLQSYEIFFTRDEKKKQMLAKASYGQHFIKDAGTVLIFFANPLKSMRVYGQRGKLYAIQDATISASYVQLAATALDLGSVWIGAFDTKEVSSIVKVSNGLKPIALIPIGYPAEKPKRRERRTIEDLVKEF